MNLRESMKMTTKIRYLCLITLLVAISGCNSLTTPKNDSTEKHRSYYPLNVGNFWEYRVLEGNDFDASITEKKSIHDTTYFVVNISNGGQNLLRSQDSSIYRRTNNKDYIVLKFNATLNRSWTADSSERQTYIDSRGFKWKVPAGTYEDCIRVVSVSRIDSTITIFAPGVGPIWSQMYGKNGVIVIAGGQSLTQFKLNQ